MIFQARAKSPGACAMASCTLSGTKIYEGDGLRVMACTEGHAKAVSLALSRPPAGMALALYHERLAEGLRVFNERPVRFPPAAGQEDDYDIDF